jgi:hypothetical protein
LIGVADLGLLLCADALGRAIARLCLRAYAVNPDRHGVVNVIAEHDINGDQVGPVAVAGKLDAVGQSCSANRKRTEERRPYRVRRATN